VKLSDSEVKIRLSLVDESRIMAMVRPSIRSVRFASAPPESRSSPAEVLRPAGQNVLVPRSESASIPNTNQLTITSLPTITSVVKDVDSCKDDGVEECNDEGKDISNCEPDPCPEVIDPTKIQKPPGEVGRPGRGGYNLQVVLKWEVAYLRSMKVNIFYLTVCSY